MMQILRVSVEAVKEKIEIRQIGDQYQHAESRKPFAPLCSEPSLQLRCQDEKGPEPGKSVRYWRSHVTKSVSVSARRVRRSQFACGWTHTGFGMPLFWPWSKEFSSPLILTFGIRYKDFAALFSLSNLWVCTYELLTCSAITAVALALWKRTLKSRSFEHFGSAEEGIL